MKRLYLLLLLCLLTGCSAVSAAEQNAPRLMVGPPAEAEPPAEEPIRYAVNMVTWEDAVQAEDGTALASYSFQVPVLSARREDGAPIQDPQTEAEEQAAAVADAFNQKFEDWAAAGEFREVADMAAERWAAQQAEEDAPIWVGEYTLELTSSAYQTDRMVSVAGVYYSFTGGAHDNTALLAWNFDLDTGALFDVSILAEDGPAFLAAVKEELIRQANTPQPWEWYALLNGAAGAPEPDGWYCVPAYDYWENYEDIMGSWSSYAVSFDETGMTVGFSPYELASYAAGPQSYRLPYGWLSPYLSRQGRTMLGLEES